MKLKHLVLGIGGVLAVAAPSCAVSAPTATGTYVACYKTSGGDLRFTNEADGCDPGEQQATWNQTGPAGPAGPAGAPGVNGNGPTYIDTSISSPISASGATTQVAALVLPPGTYDIRFTAGLSRVSGTGGGLVYCYGNTGSNLKTRASSNTLWDHASMSFHGTLTVPVTGPLLAYCYALHADPAFPNSYNLADVVFTATRNTEIISQ